jgi:hypothetical protein
MLNMMRNSARQRKGTLLGLIAFLAVIGALMLNTAATVLLTRASMANYPGGHALARLNERYVESSRGKIDYPSHFPLGLMMGTS